MFDLGWGELVVIGIVALIAIGPKELPTVLRTIGQMLGKVRRMANEFQGQFQEALREADVADLKKQADEVASSFNTNVTDFTNFDPLADTKKELADTQRELEQSLDLSAPEKTAELPAPADQSPPLPVIDVPPPSPPAAVTEKDFAAAEPPPSEEPPKQAGGKA